MWAIRRGRIPKVNIQEPERKWTPFERTDEERTAAEQASLKASILC
jgi:hypothetical protein